MQKRTGRIPDHVPQEWTSRYSVTDGPARAGVGPVRLDEIARSARRDTLWLALAGVLCLMVLALTLGWVGLALQADLGVAAAAGAVLAVSFGTCLWLVHRSRDADP